MIVIFALAGLFAAFCLGADARTNRNVTTGTNNVGLGESAIESVMKDNLPDGWQEISEDDFEAKRLTVVTLGAAGPYPVAGVEKSSSYNVEFFGPTDDRKTSLDAGTRTLRVENWTFVAPSGQVYYRARFLRRATARPK